MATIYKRTQDRGKRRTPWYIGYTDHTGRRRTAKGFTDKAETERLAAQLEDDARLIRQGLKEPDNELLAEHKHGPISGHIQEFEKHLRNRDITNKQVSETISRLNRMISDCGFDSVADMKSHDIESFLGELRASGKSKQTSNHFLKAIKQFCRWLVRTKRSDHNPAADIRRLNVQTDRRHDRRAISGDEFALLIEAAEAGPVIESIAGTDRAMMYILSAWTGYRKAEIGSLTTQSFNLESDPPTLTVQAAFSKRKRHDTQVLHPAVVERFVAWLQAKPNVSANTLLFPVSGKVPGGTERKTHKMMQRDMDAARKAWIEDAPDAEESQRRQDSDFLRYEDSNARYADFHSNRHTFITNLGRAGVSPKTTQELARHSDIRLTLNVYTHAELADKIEAVRRLPSPPTNGEKSNGKTRPQKAAGDKAGSGWECSGSAPESQTGTDRQFSSQGGNGKPRELRPDESPQSLAGEALGTTCRGSAADVVSIPERIRTSNLRLRRPTLYPIEPRGLLPRGWHGSANLPELSPRILTRRSPRVQHGCEGNSPINR
jgi:integrase/recombinase XerD